MKIPTLAVATALSLTSSLALAQPATVAPGSPPPERPATVAPGAAPRVVDPAGTIDEKTTGMAPVVRPATPGVAPGARDKSRVGGEGVNDQGTGK